VSIVTLVPTPVDAPFRLSDGRALQFGEITPASRPLIERAVAHLSPETSRRRFFTVRYRLSERELDELTHLDGIRRYAVGASVVTPGGEVEGVGVARYVRDADDETVAELAILVVDAYQGRGVGRTLLARLAGAALERSITRFRGMVLIDNEPMLRLLREYAPDLALVRIDDYFRVDVPLSFRAPSRYAGGPLSSMTLPSGSLM
jgi:GNAT superfamily N-acetyltransferase